MRRALAVLTTLALLAAACGETSENAGPLEIERAEWVSGRDEARAVVSGKWVRGLSTPPTCALLEDGALSEWPKPGANTSPDGNSFEKEFLAHEGSSPDPLLDYHVRCTVNLSTGRTFEAFAPVSGDVPRT